MSKFKLIAGAILVLVIVLAWALGGNNKTPATTTANSTTVSTSTSSTTSASSSGVPNFGGGSGGSGGSTATGAALARQETQGVDIQNSNPVLRTQEHQYVVTHPLYQRLPVTSGSVTLDVGEFGSLQQPGIQVIFSGSAAHARRVVASVFAHYHDHERGYEIRYNR